MNYIEAVPSVKIYLINYLMNDYEKGDNVDGTLKSFNTTKYVCLPLSVAIGSFSVLYVLRNNVPILDFVGIIAAMYSFGFISIKLAIDKQIKYIDRVINSEFQRADIKEKILDFYKVLDRATKISNKRKI